MAYGKQAKESTLLSPSMKISRKIDNSGGLSECDNGEGREGSRNPAILGM